MSLPRYLNEEESDPAQAVLQFLKMRWPFKVPTKFGEWPKKSWESSVFVNTLELSTWISDTLDMGGNVSSFKSNIEIHILYKKKLSLGVQVWLEGILTGYKIEHTPVHNVSASQFPKQDTFFHLVSKVTF